MTAPSLQQFGTIPFSHGALLPVLKDYRRPNDKIAEWLRQGTLVEILPQYRAEPMPVSLIYPHRRNLSRRVHLFMEWLASVMKEYVDSPA